MVALAAAREGTTIAGWKHDIFTVADRRLAHIRNQCLHALLLFSPSRQAMPDVELGLSTVRSAGYDV